MVRYRRGAPIRQFERIPGRRAEALDSLVYAFTVRGLATVSLDAREAELRGEAAPAAPPGVIRSRWMER